MIQNRISDRGVLGALRLWSESWEAPGLGVVPKRKRPKRVGQEDCGALTSYAPSRRCATHRACRACPRSVATWAVEGAGGWA